jgi:aspartyl-tRNA(Asn)/glutamyl-tRNA(Gln) amidotransferase subunit A
MNQDLTFTRAELLSQRTTATEQMHQSLAQAQSAEAAHAFISTTAAGALAAAAAADLVAKAGLPVPALAGLAVSVKDLFDVQGEITAAGSVVLASAPAAAADCPAVQRLRSAGAALMGRTNMSEFAFSGVGINPHHGTPANVATRLLDAQARVPGGSTSGGAVSVASGAAFAALGSDTGGSIRIPAALQGLVGFKNTARLTPAEGAIPLSTTLDTVSAITLSVRDAVLMHEILAQRRVTLAGLPLASLRLGVPTTLLVDGLEPAVAAAFRRAVATLSRAGAQIEELPMAPLADMSGLMPHGGFAAVESFAWHRQLLQDHGDRYDPRVAHRIRRGQSMSGAEYIDLLQARQHWMTRMAAAAAPFDALLSPTVPIVAPPLAPLLSSDEAFFATNALLLRNPSVVNLLDGCALSLPCHAQGEWPVGLMVWSTALRDDAVLDAALQIEAELAAGSA